jgi:dihydropteroate synthase
MVRVVHFAGPEDARDRLRALGVPPGDAARLAAELRSFLLSVPLDGIGASALAACLGRAGVAAARGERRFFFSVSSREQVDAWAREDPGGEGAWAPVLEALDRHAVREFEVACRDRVLRLGGTPRIMGVINVTPDSFFDGGRFATREAAVRRALELAEEGADILDLGGESTRPGSRGVPAGVESERVIPVLRDLAGRTGALLSIDTTKAAVAREAAEAGVHILNDTSALGDDPQMPAVARESGCAVVLMHRRGTPETMQRSPYYWSLLDEILDELGERVAAAEAAGIPAERILVDPGIGFGKRLEDNLALHRHLPEMRNLGRPILIGPSRKAFLGAVTGKEAQERAFGTAAAVAAAVFGGAHVIRVHDVKEMRDVVRAASAIAGGEA